MDAALPYQGNIGSVELTLAGNTIDKRIVSKNLPFVSNLRINSSVENNDLFIRWDGKDSDNDQLTYMIQLQSIEGIWETISIGYKRPEVILSSTQLTQKKWVLLRVIANDGFHSSLPVEIAIDKY